MPTRVLEYNEFREIQQNCYIFIGGAQYESD